MFHRRFNDLFQQTINGKPYYTFKVESVDYCGGFKVHICGICLVHADAMITLIGICNAMCLSCTVNLHANRIEIF